MADKEEKRRLLGIEDGKPLPTFGKRNPKPPVVEDDKDDQDLEEFRNEARSVLKEGRARSDAEWEEAKAEGKRASIFNLIRKKRGEDEPEEPDALSEEEEWHRRMAAADRPDEETK